MKIRPLVLTKFLCIGGFAALSHAAMTGYLITYHSIPPLPSYLIGWIIAWGISFIGNSQFTFAQSTVRSRFMIGKHLLTSMLSNSTSSLIFLVFFDIFQSPFIIGFAIANVVACIQTWVLYRYWVFSSTRSQNKV